MIVFAIVWLVVGIALILTIAWLCLVVAHQEAIIEWCDEREGVMRDVFQACRAVEGHQWETRGGGDSYSERQARVIHLKQGNHLSEPINYQTLIDMVIAEQDQRGLLVVALDHVALWETEHPLPSPPSLFGHALVRS